MLRESQFAYLLFLQVFENPTAVKHFFFWSFEEKKIIIKHEYFDAAQSVFHQPVSRISYIRFARILLTKSAGNYRPVSQFTSGRRRFMYWNFDVARKWINCNFINLWSVKFAIIKIVKLCSKRKLWFPLTNSILCNGSLL